MATPLFIEQDPALLVMLRSKHGLFPLLNLGQNRLFIHYPCNAIPHVPNVSFLDILANFILIESQENSIIMKFAWKQKNNIFI